MPESNPIQRSPELRCETWECLIPDALDGALSAEELAAFERHGQQCAACARMLQEVRQGAAWLGFLEDQPEVPAHLLDKILARTGGAERPAFALPARLAAPSPARSPLWRRGAIPVTRRVLESRSLRTAAMAFFSLALTLNLMGIRLSEARLSDLRPAALRAHLTRQYYSADAQVVKYCENLRFVYKMEALARELRQSAEPAPTAMPPSPASRNGGADRESPVFCAETKTRVERNLA